MIPDFVLNCFRGKNVLVTGGTGLIGRQVVDILCDAGAYVTVSTIDSLKLREDVAYFTGDLTNFSSCMRVVQYMDYVFHMAGIKASVDVARTQIASHCIPMLMFNTNVLEACRLREIPKVLYTSSIGAYSANRDTFKESLSLEGDYDGPPMDFAGWAKRMGELQCYAYQEQYGLNYAVVRPANVYGPGDNFDPDNAMVIPALMARIANGENPLKVWGDGSAIRDFAYSKDVAEGVILAMHFGTNGRPVNLGGDIACSIKDLVEHLRDITEFEYEFDTTKPSGFSRRVMDISLARKMLGYSPSTPLSKGLKETWEWFMSHRDEYKLKQNYFTREVKQ